MVAKEEHSRASSQDPLEEYCQDIPDADECRSPGNILYTALLPTHLAPVAHPMIAYPCADLQ
eukprot:428519-Pelagomonas_calceolata.AAC.5